MGTAERGWGACVVGEGFLHPHGIPPLVELKAHLGIVADVVKTHGGVECDAGRIGEGDTSEGLAVALDGKELQKGGVEGAGDALSTGRFS